MKIRPKTFKILKELLLEKGGVFIRYDSTRLKGNVAIVDDDGEFAYE